MTAQPAPKAMDAYSLVSAIDQYIRDNKHSRDVNARFMASYLSGAPLTFAKEVRNGASDLTKAEISKFRVAEIEEEKADKQREIDRLDAEANRLLRGAA